MMSVHIADEKVENGHVHEIEEFPAGVVRRRDSNARAIAGVHLPRRFPVLVVTSAPRVSPHLSVWWGMEAVVMTTISMNLGNAIEVAFLRRFRKNRFKLA